MLLSNKGNGKVHGYKLVYVRHSVANKRNSPALVYARVFLGSRSISLDPPFLTRHVFIQHREAGDSHLRRYRVWLSGSPEIQSGDRALWDQHSFVANEAELFDIVEDAASLVLIELANFRRRLRPDLSLESILKKYDSPGETLMTRDKLLLIRDKMIDHAISKGDLPARSEWPTFPPLRAPSSGGNLDALVARLSSIDEKLDWIKNQLTLRPQPQPQPAAVPVTQRSPAAAPAARRSGAVITPDMDIKGEGIADAMVFSDNKM